MHSPQLRAMRKLGLITVLALTALLAAAASASADSEQCGWHADPDLVRGYVGPFYLHIAASGPLAGQEQVCFRLSNGSGIAFGGVAVIDPGQTPPVAFDQDPSGFTDPGPYW